MQKSLDNCLGLELEISFAEIYKDIPLFGDINSFLIKKGFEFIDFITITRWERKERKNKGQAVFGDGLWLRSPEFFINKDYNSVINYIAICALYGRFDLIDKTLELKSNILSKSQYRVIKILKNSQLKTRFILKFIQAILFSLSDESTPRSHLMY